MLLRTSPFASRVTTQWGAKLPATIGVNWKKGSIVPPSPFQVPVCVPTSLPSVSKREHVVMYGNILRLLNSKLANACTLYRIPTSMFSFETARFCETIPPPRTNTSLHPEETVTFCDVRFT